MSKQPSFGAASAGGQFRLPWVLQHMHVAWLRMKSGLETHSKSAGSFHCGVLHRGQGCVHFGNCS